MKIREEGWRCSWCGDRFLSRSQMYSHLHKEHPDRCKPQKDFEWKCKYCGAVLSSRRKLYKHHESCEAKSKLPIDSMGRTIDEEGHKRSSETIRRKIESGELVCKGHPHTPEWRAHMAKIMRAKKGITDVQCNYNVRACQYIDQLNESKGWKLQHALNGGEVRVGPYSLDGYDREKNIAFEFDEDSPRHNSKKGRERDIARQQYIIGQIGCEFWRYSEREDRLYRV